MLERKHPSTLTALALVVVAFAQALAVPVSTAESHALVNGVTIAYRVQGRSDGRPILVICGTGMQMVELPQELVSGLIADGYRVIPFDNRDSGHSTHFNSAGAPDRVRSLTLLMVNSGNPAIPLPADPVRAAAIPPPPLHESKEDQISRPIKTYKALSGRGYPVDNQQLFALARFVTERDSETWGVARQGAVLIVLGDLRTRLATIKAPAVVIDGDDDPLISPAVGKEVAEAIPGSRFLLIKGMGHSLPAQAVGLVLEAMSAVGEKP